MSRLKAEIVEFLGETQLLAGWPREDLETLAHAMSVRPLEPEETLFEERQPGDAMYLLLEGRLSAWRGEEEVGDLLEGDHLGEGALVRPGPRRVTVRGADPSSIADAYARLGDWDEAFEWLERTLEEAPESLLYIKVSPTADLVRDDPRFKRLLERIGLGD